MTIDDIRRIIAPDEHRELELKKTTGELKEGMHSACAFLNTDGGWLIFGITPNSLKIVGEQVTDNTQREIAKNEFLDTQRRSGNFFDLLDAGMEFAYKHLNLGGKIVGLHREDKLEIPIKALREALTNAYCHRTYDSPSASVSLAIFDDRLEIENPGRLPNQLTIESLMQPHNSFPMNPDIANFMFKTTYLDSWGSGVKRMVDACREANVPVPRYELRPGGLVIIFERPKRETEGGDDTKNDTNDVTKNILDNITERQRLIVKRLILTGVRNVTRNVTINVTENADTLAVCFNVTKRTIKRDLVTLQSLGIIKHEGPTKGGNWLVLVNII